MSVQVTLDLTPQPAMQMRPSPMLVGFAEMHALPSMEMERVVAQELADNPALERVEEAACGFCGRRSPNCPVCGVRPGDPDGGQARWPQRAGRRVRLGRGGTTGRCAA